METQGQSALKERVKVKEPDLYDVILLNDDFTTMDFVVMVLRQVFFKTDQDAEKIMLDVHQKGSGVAGTYTYDIARSKVSKAQRMAREAGFPLRFRIKKQA